MDIETAFHGSWPFMVNEEEGRREWVTFIMYHLAYTSLSVCILPFVFCNSNIRCCVLNEQKVFVSPLFARF